MAISSLSSDYSNSFASNTMKGQFATKDNDNSKNNGITINGDNSKNTNAAISGDNFFQIYTMRDNTGISLGSGDNSAVIGTSASTSSFKAENGSITNANGDAAFYKQFENTFGPSVNYFNPTRSSSLSVSV